eukprot:4580831-Pyramimonas_sp.AAC.1
MHKLMFEAFVTGAPYSGMVAFVLPPSLIKVTGSTLAKLLRCLAEGGLSWTDEKGETRCSTNKEVFKYWGLNDTATTLRMRSTAEFLRLFFGDSRLGQLRQTPRMTPDKYVGPPGSAGQSTPWAIQFREDMGALAHVDESMSAWRNARASDLDIFLPGNTKTRRKVGPEGQEKEVVDIFDKE